MSDIGVGFKVDRSGLSRGLKRSSRSISKWSKDASKNINDKLVGGFKQIPSALGVGLGVAGVVLATKKLAQYEAQLTRLSIQGKMTKKEQMELGEEINNVAIATGQSRTSIVQGLDAVVQRTGDIEQAKNIMSDLAVASQGTGAGMSDLGATAALLKRDFGAMDKDMMKFFDLFTAQGKKGSFTLQDMASQTEKLFASAGRFDMTGITGATEIGALAQVARMATSSAEEAATAVKATFSDVIKNRGKIEKMGISFKSEDGSQKSMTDILKEIVTATKGDKQQQKLQKIFNERSIPLITKLSSGLNKEGNFRVLDQFMLKEKEFAGTIAKDNERFMGTAGAQMGRIGALAEVLADKALSGTLENMAGAIDELTKDPEAMKDLQEAIEGIGVAVTAVTKVLGMALTGWGKIFNLANDLANSADDAWRKKQERKNKIHNNYLEYASSVSLKGGIPLSRELYKNDQNAKAIDAWKSLPRGTNPRSPPFFPVGHSENSSASSRKSSQVQPGWG